MSEPGICPACGSSRVAVRDSRAQFEERYRRRSCRDCGYHYSSSSRSTMIEGVNVTLEAHGATKHQSRLKLARLWQRFVSITH